MKNFKLIAFLRSVNKGHYTVFSMLKNQFWMNSKIEYKPYKLFCIPFAGSSGTVVYRDWQKLFPDTVTVHAVELPGRGWRFNEQPYSTFLNLIQDLTTLFLKEVQGHFAIFGHSLGALIAFELALELSLRQRPPCILVVSGCSSPEKTKKIETSNINFSDSDLIRQLQFLNGTPKAILEDKNIMKVLLPIFRSDLIMYNNYTFIDRGLLRCPIIACAGDSDPQVPVRDVEGWKSRTRENFELHIFNGDHFFIFPHKHTVANLISDRLIKFYASS